MRHAFGQMPRRACVVRVRQGEPVIKLALTDLDDTLIPYGQGSASTRAVAALRAANAVPGLAAGPISGRTCSMLGWMFGPATDCWDTGVLVNGQVVRLHGETIFYAAPPRELLEELSCHLREREGEGVALTLYDDNDDDAVVCIGMTAEEMARHPKPFAPFKSCAPHVPDGTFVKTNIHCDRTHQEAEAIREELARAFPELSFVFPSRVASTIDITPQGVTKLSGLQMLMRELDVGIDEVCVFGDGENDLSIVEAVPNSVAVANACEAVQRAARWHIGPCTEDSVADAYLDLAASSRRGSRPSFMEG